MHVRLDEKPSYEALSYTWGDQSREAKTILLNGLLFPVGPSLSDALFHLRSDVDRLLWVDAICINQLDATEKNSQISQMSQVYRAASRVII